ncbi:MAG: hypothetical protein ABJB86_12685 [Bacteroidota bacterium]
MKKLLLAILFAIAVLSCSKSNGSSAEDHISVSQVPSAVLAGYKIRYPTASGQTEWELEHGNTYKVKFFIGPQRWQAQFSTNGTFIDETMIQS